VRRRGGQKKTGFRKGLLQSNMYDLKNMGRREGRLGRKKDEINWLMEAHPVRLHHGEIGLKGDNYELENMWEFAPREKERVAGVVQREAFQGLEGVG